MFLFLVQASGLHALAPQPVAAPMACKMGGASCCCPVQCKTKPQAVPKAKACHMKAEAAPQQQPRVVLRSCAPESKSVAPQADSPWISSLSWTDAPPPAAVPHADARDPRAFSRFTLPPLHPPAVLA